MDRKEGKGWRRWISFTTFDFSESFWTLLKQIPDENNVLYITKPYSRPV